MENMLAGTKETRILTLQDYEARIYLYKEQIGTGYIGIGRTLNEAKAAGVVPHGQWEGWVETTTGLSARQAQRCMQAATEIREGSAVARLEMSKALMLLSSGLDEEQRETIAVKATEEGATVKALKEEIKRMKLQIVSDAGTTAEIRDALHTAQAEKEQLENQMRAQQKAFNSMRDEAASSAYKRGAEDADTRNERDIAAMNQQITRLTEMLAAAQEEGKQPSREQIEEINRLKEQLAEKEKTALGISAALDGARRANKELLQTREELLEAAEEAEKRAADLEAELETVRLNGGSAQEDPAWKTVKMAVTRFMDDV